MLRNFFLHHDCVVVLYVLSHIFTLFCFFSHEHEKELTTREKEPRPRPTTIEETFVLNIEATKPRVLPPSPPGETESVDKSVKPPYWNGDWVRRI